LQVFADQRKSNITIFTSIKYKKKSLKITSFFLSHLIHILRKKGKHPNQTCPHPQSKASRYSGGKEYLQRE